jgi:hypothetical protein
MQSIYIATVSGLHKKQVRLTDHTQFQTEQSSETVCEINTAQLLPIHSSPIKEHANFSVVR